MKIYCNRREYKNDFDRFIGKDVWIKIHVWDSTHCNYVWFRLLEKRYHEYLVNAIDDRQLLSSLELCNRDKDMFLAYINQNYLNKEQRWSSKYFKYKGAGRSRCEYPISPITTEELYDEACMLYDDEDFFWEL